MDDENLFQSNLKDLGVRKLSWIFAVVASNLTRVTISDGRLWWWWQNPVSFRSGRTMKLCQAQCARPKPPIWWGFPSSTMKEVSADWEIRKLSINVISDCSCNHHRAVRLIWFVSSLDIWDEYDEEVCRSHPTGKSGRCQSMLSWIVAWVA